MSAAFDQVMEKIKNLSANENALVAHCLISSLESKQDEGVEEAWAELAEKRYAELESTYLESLNSYIYVIRKDPALCGALYEFANFKSIGS